MRALLKNWLLPVNKKNISFKVGRVFLYTFCFNIYFSKAQTVNYVNNGGFEDCSNCANYTSGQLKAKYWNPIDSNKISYIFLSKLPPSQQVPLNSYAYQWPKGGNNYIASELFLNPNTLQSKRIYPRNTLKQNLEAGKTYCVKFYCNITNVSSYGVDGCGAYFGDSSTDTITQSDRPITYLTPQVQNPAGNILKDTLNWILITGTFTANGTEKYLILGNFKSDAATTSSLINPPNAGTIWTDVLYDDVSCIALDLPAFAGYDYYMAPGDSAFIGRQPDVGIDEACTWYQPPNITTAIDTVAGLWVKPAATTTYVVRQDICGIIKWDTVVVFKSAVGIEELKFKAQSLKIYPVPASNVLNLQWDFEGPGKEFTKAEIVNSLGQLVSTVDLNYNNQRAMLDIKNLPVGLYTLKLKSVNSGEISKRFVVD